MNTTTQSPAFIRTYVPILVSAIVGWLASLGLNVSDEAQTALAVAIGGIAAAAYYAIIRWAEKRWPWVGLLLGSMKTPDGYSVGTPVEDHGFTGASDPDPESGAITDDVDDTEPDVTDDTGENSDAEEISDDLDDAGELDDAENAADPAPAGRHAAS